MELLKEYLLSKNINNLSDVLNKFETYYNLLIEWNNKFNLTSITDKKEVEIKHFIDSLFGLDFIKDNDLVCDIGAGAGFPSIPLAILKPNSKFVLIDCLNKRVNFLNNVIETLNLKNCECVHIRVEDFAKNNKNKFDKCVARAVAQMPTLLEYTIPLLKINGSLISYKSSSINNELLLSKNALKLLNSKLLKINDFILPNNDYRCIVEIIKIDSTPLKYPRSQNKPKTNPL